MLYKRSLQPTDGDVLYHYCSSKTLASIIEHRTIRFSDINMMNDFNESAYGYEVFEEAANLMLRDEAVKKAFPDFSIEVLDRIDALVSVNQATFHPVIACFSKNPDTLSQWRGYADEGRGFAVGFSASMLKRMPISLLEVEYDRETQIREMMTAIGVIHFKNAECDNPYGQQFYEDCILLANWMFAFKSHAFAEEQEVRCLHALTVNIDSEKMTLSCMIDGPDGETAGPNVKFRTSDDGAFIAYVDLPFPVTEKQPIPEIWLGPANKNGIGNIMYLLGNHGFSKVLFRGSRATYR